jgi:tRNA (mo5U34)-methyltransferase
MQRGSNEVLDVAPDYAFWDTAAFHEPGYPKLHFIEQSYSHDSTNWWAPNRACSAAMLRSAGFRIEANPEEEIFICRRAENPDPRYRAVYPARGPKP